MYFSLDAAGNVLAALGPRTRAAAERLLPGPVLLVLPGGVGLRVPSVEALAGVPMPVLQTSANLTGGPEPRRLEEVPQELRSGADLVLDGGELPGVASTVVDLSRYEHEDAWEVLREGAVSRELLSSALRS
jgi:L-threonylcarbamoyladenylate synthase